MPELPEVETVCRGLNQVTSGLTVKSALLLLQRTLAYPDIASFEEGIKGKKIVRWHRRGKYLLGELNEGWLAIHLRMTGQLLWVNQDSDIQKHTRIRLFFGENKELRFVDTRTFGKWWFIAEKSALHTIITGLGKMGAEPFSRQFTMDYFFQKLQKTHRCIKTVLLDQTVVAGIGNIYADEALFKSGILPQTKACHLTISQTEALRKAIIEVLTDSINAGGTTFSDFLQITGVNGNYGGKAWVYGRYNQPCRICGNLIDKVKLQGRTSHFCHHCQV